MQGDRVGSMTASPAALLRMLERETFPSGFAKLLKFSLRVLVVIYGKSFPENEEEGTCLKSLYKYNTTLIP